MTELHLEKRDPVKSQYRFYRIVLVPTLFGDWSVMREWGRIGSPGRLVIDRVDDLDAATLLMQRKRREKERRGYSPRLPHAAQ
jgi:predicted DNA-binding WGR domain protein